MLFRLILRGKSARGENCQKSGQETLKTFLTNTTCVDIIEQYEKWEILC